MIHCISSGWEASEAAYPRHMMKKIFDLLVV
jgi:hypothetical protein